MKETKEQKIKSGHKRKDFFGLFVCTVVGVLMFIVVAFSLKGNEAQTGDISDNYTVIELFSNDTVSEETSAVENSEIVSEEISENEENYETYHIKSNDVHKGDLILVNNEHMYLFTEDLQLKNVYKNKIREYSMATGNEELFEKTIENANLFIGDFYKNTGISNLLMYNCFVTKESQAEKYEDFISSASEEDKQYAVKPGGSDAHTGRSFKLRVYNSNGTIGQGDYAWIYENAHRYGFILRYPEDKTEITNVKDENRFRYVGIPHSAYMYENNLCLEEYISMLKETDYSSPVVYFYEGVEYKMFYAKAETYSETTEIKVQKGYSYSYSGDNMEGFVITSCVE